MAEERGEVTVAACNWTPPEGIAPAVVSAMEIAGQAPGKRVACRQVLWVLDYELRDYGAVQVGSTRAEWWRRPARAAHLYAPGTPYWEDTSALTGPRHSAWVLFTGGDQAGLTTLTEVDGWARVLDPDGLLEALLLRAARLGRGGGRAGFWSAQTVLCEVLAVLAEVEEVARPTWRVAPAPGGSDLARRVDAYLAAHLAEPVTVADLAAQLHLSPSGLAHRYRAETGASPMAARQRMRIEQAKALLLKGQPLKAIATQLGFADPFHLSKAFKRVEGRSPRAWLRALTPEPVIRRNG